MKRLAIVCLLFVAGILCWWTIDQWGSPEPVYQQRAARLWVRDLASGDYQVQEKAEQAILTMGPHVVPELMGALVEKETIFTRLRQSLGRRLPLPPTPSIDYVSLRQNAARQLGRHGTSSPAAILALVKALADEEMAVRTEAQHSLRRIGRAAIPMLVRGVQHGHPRGRSGAMEVLSDLRVANDKILSALFRACRDSDPTVRTTAIQALAGMASGKPQLIGVLEGALQDKNPQVRVAAAEAFARPGKLGTGSLRRLEEALADSASTVRIAAARAHWLQTGSTRSALPVLVAALPDPEAGWKVPFILREMGPKAAEAVPGLIEKLKSEQVPRPLRSPPVAALALGHIGSPSVPPLIELLEDSREFVRTGASLALGLVGPAAQDAIGALTEALNDPAQEVRQASVLSLANIQPSNQVILPALKEMVRDDDVFLSSTAGLILRRNHPEAAAEMGLE